MQRVIVIVGGVVGWLRALRMKVFVQGAWTLHNFNFVHVEVNSRLHVKLVPTTINHCTLAANRLQTAITGIPCQSRCKNNFQRHDTTSARP